jgi:uncharacterized phage protein (TIGR02220 family)
MTNKELWAQAAELLGEAELTRRFQLWITGLIRKERTKRSESSPDALFLNEATQILNDLNKRTGRAYTLTADAKKMIKVILGAGYTHEDFAKVHEVMVKKWIDDPNMKDYLRPSTLWQLKKFDERLALWVDKSVEAQRGRGETPMRTSANPASGDAGIPGIIAKLMAKAWWEFDTWVDFMRWTCQFPTAESLGDYPMPERIRKMRQIPRMMLNVAKGTVAPETEAEWQGIKRDYLNIERSRDNKKEEKR